MEQQIKDFKIPDTNDKFLNIAKDWISSNNKKKLVKVLNMLAKEDKKQKNNDYVSSRDLYIIGCVLIGTTTMLLDGVKTTQNGRDELLKNQRNNLQGGSYEHLYISRKNHSNTRIKAHTIKRAIM